MFTHIKRESAVRFVEVREYLNYIKTVSPDNITVELPHIVGLRGLFFVYLYGVVEYTIKNTVSTAIDQINRQQCKYSDCKPLFLGIALDGKFASLSQVGSNKKWERRWEILSHIESNEIVSVSNDLLPTDGKNIQYSQLESIWKSFCIDEPMLPRQYSGGFLNELVLNRNKIAHGDETPENIGRRYSFDDLKLRFDTLNELCSYIIDVFEEYIHHKKYLK